ncbi:MAG TPA: cytochrome C oxidase subunit IV family protein [Terriglobales bacterium]|jgi:cytochrome c oxidase subunit 4|nr:cytochrome C oxidase subunit IV family protein [Terriglobales bacterium]
MSVDTQVANHEATPQHEHKLGVFFYVWGALLVLTGAEVFLAYQNMEPVKMLMILMGLSVIKSALIILFFMHMKYESARMRRVLMPVLVICLCLMSMFFADAVRIIHLGVK